MKKDNNLSTALIAYLGLFLTFALILGYVESLIPIPIGIPGVKLGLPNLAVLMVLYLYGFRNAFIVDILRILIAGFMFGNVFSIAYSLGGGILSFLIMAGAKRTGLFSILGVSIAGGFSHNMGQLLVAYVVMGSYGVAFYAPILAIGGVITGALIGVIASIMYPRLKVFVNR